MEMEAMEEETMKSVGVNFKSPAKIERVSAGKKENPITIVIEEEKDEKS